ncbi:MAG TPA: DUF2062 domain-containing protein [Burkholderiales bacterium]|nr:DUF2062 domain-containing protein [Burkholderiales bacterium]
MLERIRRWRLPSREEVQSHRSLRWLGPLLHRPWLWHLDRRSVALGAAIGVFFGFMVPVLQILFSAFFALLLRANLPVAAVSTLVSNPFTYAPIGVLAYRMGSALLGEPLRPAEAAAIERSGEDVPLAPQSWSDRVAALGKPLIVGLSVFAVVGALSTWVLVNVAWVVVTRLRRGRAPPVPPDP